MNMEAQTVKAQKVVWSREFHQFASDLEKALWEGWRVVPHSVVMTVMPESKGSNGGERYLIILEK